jgi:hypothetical protein
MSDAKELLKELSKRLNSNALSAAVGASNLSDVKFDDASWGEITGQLNGLLTKDAALADKEILESVKKSIFPQHKKTILEEFEGKLKPLASKFGINVTGANANEMFDVFAGEIEKKVTGQNPDADNLVKSLKADKEALASKLVEFESNYVPKSELDKIQSDFRSKQLQKEFFLKTNSHQLADVYNDPRIKKALINDIYNEITSTARLDFNEDESGIRVLQKDLDKELYVNNKPVKFDDLISEKLQPYLKKSEPAKPTKTAQSNKQIEPINHKPNVSAFAAQKAKYLESMK